MDQNRIDRTFNNQRYVLVSHDDYSRITWLIAGKSYVSNYHRPVLTSLFTNDYRAIELTTTEQITFLDVHYKPTVVVAASDWVQ